MSGTDTKGELGPGSGKVPAANFWSGYPFPASRPSELDHLDGQIVRRRPLMETCARGDREPVSPA
ncbi:hypothetical protein GCM10010214_49020 [Streptomyces abikoensis]|nr:hypothetical protein GCM10010214_49020 [Streptomyces abikoensis]